MVNLGTCGIENNCQKCHFDPIEIHVKQQTRLGCGKLSRVDQPKQADLCLRPEEQSSGVEELQTCDEAVWIMDERLQTW